jgi:hypothetical protein
VKAYVAEILYNSTACRTVVYARSLDEAMDQASLDLGMRYQDVTQAIVRKLPEGKP